MPAFTAVKRAVIKILPRLVEFLAVSLSSSERGSGPGAIIRRYSVGSFFVLPRHFRSGFDGYRLRLELIQVRRSGGVAYQDDVHFIVRRRPRTPTQVASKLSRYFQWLNT